MWHTAYIAEVKKALRDQHGCKQIVNEDGTLKGGENAPCVVVADGVYDCLIDGKIDHIKINHQCISCCNFDEERSV